MAIGAMNTVVDVLIFGFEKLVASAAWTMVVSIENERNSDDRIAGGCIKGSANWT